MLSRCFADGRTGLLTTTFSNTFRLPPAIESMVMHRLAENCSSSAMAQAMKWVTWKNSYRRGTRSKINTAELNFSSSSPHILQTPPRIPRTMRNRRENVVRLQVIRSIERKIMRGVSNRESNSTGSHFCFFPANFDSIHKILPAQSFIRLYIIRTYCLMVVWELEFCSLKIA